MISTMNSFVRMQKIRLVSALAFNFTICYYILHICPRGAALFTVHSQEVSAQDII